MSDQGSPVDVSVITTVYQPDVALLDASMRSLADQTLAATEFIVVLDGPLPPSALTVLDRHASADERIRIIEPGRIGRGAALNVGVEAARGRFIAILDADDLAHPRRLERQAAYLDRSPSVDLVATGSLQLSPSAVSTHRWPSLDAPFAPNLVGRRLLMGNPITHSAVMVRREALDAIGGYSVDRNAQFDYDLFLRLREGGARLALGDEVQVVRVVHDGQAFSSSRFIGRALDSYRLQLEHARRDGPATFAMVIVFGGGRLVWRVIRQGLRRRSIRR